MAALPGLTLCFPNQTFEGKLVFHGAHRRAELLSYDGGHTPSAVSTPAPVGPGRSRVSYLPHLLATDKSMLRGGPVMRSVALLAPIL